MGDEQDEPHNDGAAAPEDAAAGTPDAGATDGAIDSEAPLPDAAGVGGEDGGHDAAAVDLGAEAFRVVPRIWAATLAPGTRVAIPVDVHRAPWFDERVMLEARGLPLGVLAYDVEVRRGEAAGLLELRADWASETPGPRPFQLVASAADWEHQLRLTVHVVAVD